MHFLISDLTAKIISDDDDEVVYNFTTDKIFHDGQTVYLVCVVYHDNETDETVVKYVYMDSSKDKCQFVESEIQKDTKYLKTHSLVVNGEKIDTAFWKRSTRRFINTWVVPVRITK